MRFLSETPKPAEQDKALLEITCLFQAIFMEPTKSGSQGQVLSPYHEETAKNPTINYNLDETKF